MPCKARKAADIDPRRVVSISGSQAPFCLGSFKQSRPTIVSRSAFIDVFIRIIQLCISRLIQHFIMLDGCVNKCADGSASIFSQRPGIVSARTIVVTSQIPVNTAMTIFIFIIPTLCLFMCKCEIWPIRGSSGNERLWPFIVGKDV